MLRELGFENELMYKRVLLLADVLVGVAVSLAVSAPHLSSLRRSVYLSETLHLTMPAHLTRVLQRAR